MEEGQLVSDCVTLFVGVCAQLLLSRQGLLPLHGGITFSVMDAEKPPPPDKRLSRFEIGVCGGKGQQQARIFPHEGHVFLDIMEDGSTVVTHSITLKQQVLPPDKAPWELVWLEDNDGLGCVVGYGGYPDPPQTLFLQKWMDRQLYIGVDDCLHVIEMRNGQTISRWSLTEKQREFDEQKVLVDLADGSTLELAASFCKWPRDGCRYFWHLVPIYDQLKFKLCSGEASKWAYQQLNAGPLTSLRDEIKCKQPSIKSNHNLMPAVALKSTDAFSRDQICVIV